MSSRMGHRSKGIKGLFPCRFARAHQRKRTRGATAVEMALIAPVFFMMLMGVTESSLIMAAQQLLENASFNSARLAKTGYVTTGQTQGQTVQQVLFTELQSFGDFFDTTKVTMTQESYNSFSAIGGTGGTSGYGTQQQIVVYTVTYPWKVFTPMIGALMGVQDPNGNWVVNLTSRIVVRNEPYG